MFNLAKPAISIVLMSALIGFPTACSHGPSDETIAKDIQSKAAADPVTKDSQVSVAAKDGKVTLSGQAANPAAQQELEQIARQEPGVTGVDDQSTVAGAAAPGGNPAQARAPAPAPAAAPPPPAPKPKPQPVVIPAGTVLTIRTGQALSSKTSQTGQPFMGTLAQPVKGKALPAGSSVTGTVVTAKAKGKIKGEGQLDLALTSIAVHGHTYPIKTALLSSTVKGKGKRTAVTTGAGAGGGALIGGLAGGGKGAAIGALAGAGAGFIGGTFTGNKQIEIPAETPLSFTMSAPLTLSPAAE
jgi:BON domain-containing protein